MILYDLRKRLLMVELLIIRNNREIRILVY